MAPPAGSHGPLARVPRALLLFGALALVSTCSSPTDPHQELRRPAETDDGWETASLESVGIDPEPLKELVALVDGTHNHEIHGILIVKDQQLVFEQYWRGTDLNPGSLQPITRDFNRETLHYVASVSKSITSILTGIAIDQGRIASVNDLLFSYFPEHQDLETAENGMIALRHLLSFTSGLEWNEFEYGFDDPRDSHYQMFNNQDPIRWLLGREMDSSPGTVFHYNSGDTNLMGEIVRKATSSPNLQAFAEDHLFEPLEVEEYGWVDIDAAAPVAFASGGVSLRPRDMAKLGALFLNGGSWKGNPVVSQGWIDESIATAIPFEGSYRSLYGYGYNWWLGRSQISEQTAKYFRAAGWGGQYVYAYPDLDLVLVFTGGGFYESRPLDTEDLIEDYILRAIQ